MIWQILDWVTIAGMVVLLAFGIRMAAGPGQQVRSASRRNGILLILASLPGLAIRLPLLLGWPRSVRLAIDIPAMLLLVVVGFFMVLGLKRQRRMRQQNG